MEKLTKFAFYFGIAIAATIFVMILTVMLPHVIENAERDWKRAMGSNMTDEELKTLLYSDPSYNIFKEKYPDAIENFESWNRGEGRLNLAAYNYTNLNEVRLDISYDSHQQKVRSHANCQVYIPGNEREIHRGMDGTGVPEFIERMDCLNITMPGEIDDMMFGESNYGDFTPQIVRVD